MRNVSDYELANPVYYGIFSWRSVEPMMNLALGVANELLAALEAYSPGQRPMDAIAPLNDAWFFSKSPIW